MNLVPIDTGGTATDLVGGDPTLGGDFAALMSGLMTGDTQIVPLFDLPTGEQLPGNTETPNGDETADVDASILEFIGTPPPGLAVSPRVAEASPNEVSSIANGIAAQIGSAGEPVEIEGAPPAIIPPADSAVEGLRSDTAIDSADGPALATVHPISNRLANSSHTEFTTSSVGVADSAGAGQQPLANSPAQTENVPQIEADPTKVTPLETPARRAETNPASNPASTNPASTNPLGAPSAPVEGLLQAPSPQSQAESTSSRQPRTEAIASDPEVIDEVELDQGITNRPFETARPSGRVTQPALVGIARRVEEAIAALATKPDPKIVTLQLDELDGLRLTVALRPDGIHLSSNGGTGLTTEIERALATRGFDMASGDRRNGQGTDEGGGESWRPQPAPPGRSRTTSSDIRL